VEVKLHEVLTSALDGGEWPASRPDRFATGEMFLGTHWIGGWVVPRAGLDAVAKRKYACHCRESNPGRPVRSLVVKPLSQNVNSVGWIHVDK
jgi:hypothetical protein